MTEQQLLELISQMSIEDKVAQLLQIGGGCYEEDNVLTGPSEMYGVDEDIVYSLGSVINSIGAQKTKKIQDRYLEKSKFKIPLLFMSDIIYGLKTIFPIPLGMACTWDMSMVQESARVAAKEAAVSGQHVTFSPMADLVRDARWGRVLEATGEDAYLNGEYVKAMVKGYQGDSLLSGENIAACVKHFAAYGAPVAGREYNTVDMSERVLRQDYLPAYKAAIDAGCEMVMTSFNLVDGIPSSGNKWLSRDILRNEWGFEGVLISDASAIEELVAHGVAEDKKEAAKMAIEASVDIDMMSPVYIKHLKTLIEEGQVEERLLDEAVVRILRLKNKLGLFENPYGSADEEKEKEIILCEEHRNLARKVAAKSCVLLKNNGILPLQKTVKNIALIGPYADNQDLYGGWAIHVNKEDVVTIKEGIVKKLEVDSVKVAKGSKIVRDESRIYPFGTIFEMESESDLDEGKLLEEAKEVARQADIIVLALGEHLLQSGEGGSRGELTLPEPQLELFREIKKFDKPIVVLLFNGRPLDLRELQDGADAILECWFPGTEGGNAVADLLFNDEMPSGKLTMTFPYCVGQVPIYYNEMHTGRPYKREVPTRFASIYTDIPNEPLYPFGYGMSYTTFNYENMRLSHSELIAGQVIKASCQVTNTGQYRGEEVVQLYIQDCVGSVARPVKELKGFKKISLEPGETKEVVFNITEEMLKYYTASYEYKAEKGEFNVFIGKDSQTYLKQNFVYKD